MASEASDFTLHIKSVPSFIKRIHHKQRIKKLANGVRPQNIVKKNPL